MGEEPWLAAERLAAVRASGLLDTDPEEHFDALARLAGRLLDAPFAFITVVDDRRSFWKSRVGIEGAQRQNAVEESFCQYVVASDDALVLEDVREHPMTRANPSIESMGVVAWAGYPVRSPDGQVLGTLCVVDTRPRAWTAEDREVLDTLSRAASTEVALRVAEAETRAARQDAEAHAARLQLLTGSDRALGEPEDTQRVLASVVRLVGSAMRASAAVYLVEGDVHVRGRAVHHDDADVLAGLRRLLEVNRARLDDRWGPGRAIAARSTQRLPLDVAPLLADVGPDTARAAAALGISDGVVVPLVSRQRAFGALDVLRHDGSRFSDDDVRVLEEIASRVALTLDNAILAQARVELSLRLQTAALTPPPAPRHVAVAVRYAPASLEAQIGGDWYDAFHQEDGALVVVVGDVTGHDQAAAVSMSGLRSLVRAIAWDSGAGPGEVLRRTDRALVGLGQDVIATAVVAALRPSGDGAAPGAVEVVWSSAGQPCPVVLRADGRAVQLDDETDLLLGVAPERPRGEHELVLLPGETLLLFSDGLVERRDRPVVEGVSSLLRALEGLRSADLEDLADQVLDAVAPPPRHDDVALVAVRPR